MTSSSSLRFRHKRAVTDIVKTDEVDIKDHVTSSIQSSRICDLNSAPSNEGQLAEMVSMKGIKRENDHVSFKPCFKSLLYVHGSSNNLKAEAADKRGDSSPSQQDSNHGPTIIEHEVDGGSAGSELILMGCIRCYLYVMVCDDNPKCPRCRKADCLRDMFREKPVIKGNKIMKFDH